MPVRKPTAQEKARAREAADRAEGKKPKATRKRKAKEPEPVIEVEGKEDSVDPLLTHIATEAKREHLFQEGNQFWKYRSSHGRDPIYKTSEDLWSACEEYFEWVSTHPLWEEKAFAYQGAVTVRKVAKMRAMTLEHMRNFIGISEATWINYRKRDDDYLRVTREVEDIIPTQKFTGAAADLLNANIIARDLGLRDQNTHEHTGKDGGPIETKGEMGDIELARRAGFMIGQAIEKQKHDKKVKEPTDEVG